MRTDHEIPKIVFQEFFLWLLVNSELNGGTFELEGEFIVFRIEDQLKLEGEGDVRQIDFKKGVPSISNEVKAALKTKKLPSKMKCKLIIGEDQYVFSLSADSMEISAVKIPLTPLKEPELKMDQRMFHASQIYRILGSLFAAYAENRVSVSIWRLEEDKLNNWINELA